MSKVTIKYKGQTVDCYGEMYPEQNISVVCVDEEYDGIWAEGYDNWTKAVHAIIDSRYYHDREILQLEAC